MTNQRLINLKRTAAFAAVILATIGVRAQFGGPMAQGPQFSGLTAKLFGDHQAFSATMQFETEGGPQGGKIMMDGSFALLNGMTRFEMDMTKMQGANIPPNAKEQMARMGMDKMVAISSPEKKMVYMMYPSMNAYFASTLPDSTGSAAATDYKVEVTETGSETVDGHDCVKNKVVVTGSDGVPHESTVWNAKDMGKFPLKIETADNGRQITMNFKDVKLEKPDASLFDPPANYKKYDSMTDMMMSRFRGQ